MKTKLTLFLIAIFGFASLTAQEFVQVPLGGSYANQAYYNIGTDAMDFLPNQSWDLAFATAPGSAGIFVNEASASSMAGAAPELRLYLSYTTDFAEEIEPALLAFSDSLYNEEIDWDNGAFNNPKDALNSDDYGWGTYNPANQAIEGDRVFALQLRNDSWKKIFIESMASGLYTLKYADLDGANEGTITIDKADFAGSPLVLYSFTTGTAEASPANWDLLFTRYRTALDPGDGVLLQYMVTGVLSGPGVETAEARGVDPLTVDYEPYLDSLGTQLDIIGQDWKRFDLGSFMWIVDPERAFFVKTADNLWKVVFYAFDGTSTGIFTFEKTYLGLIQRTESPSGNVSGLSVFPNPAVEDMTVSFSLKEQRLRLPLSLVDGLGRTVWQTAVRGDAGLNVLNLRLNAPAAGVYWLVVGNGGDRVAAKVVGR